jgi:alcohol dehydrogenase class IV
VYGSDNQSAICNLKSAISAMNFEFATAARIVFGAGRIVEAGAIAAGFGSRALVVTGGNPDRAGALLESLRAKLAYVSIVQAPKEPTIASASAGAQQARDEQIDMVIGFGGGSAIDTGKAIAALATNQGDPLDYLEVIGKAQPLHNAPLPYIAIPTTAGSGAEVTRNAVLSAPEARVKVSLRSPLMLPRVALIDPQLTHSLPPAVTAATGMDALTQLIEPYVSPRATPMTDALCADGIVRASRALLPAYANGEDAVAREAMATASLFGGLALANSGLGAVHGFAAPIGGMFDAPHGAVCAQLLPLVWRANVAALRERAPKHPALIRYDRAAQLITGEPDAWIDEGERWLFELRAALGIPSLSAYGITSADIESLAAKAAVASSMQANPVKLTELELQAILEAAI